MNATKLNDWLQVIGLFGVIGSLMFVGLQLKQEQEIAMSAAYQARSQQISDIATAWADNPAARGAIIKLQSGRAQEVTPDEALALNFYESALLNAYENIHYQYLSGFVTEEHWEKSRAGIKNSCGVYGGGLPFSMTSVVRTGGHHSTSWLNSLLPR